MYLAILSKTESNNISYSDMVDYDGTSLSQNTYPLELQDS